MAAVQKTKVRPILNLSAPAGSSFNDAVDKNHLRKLSMSSAKKFSQTLVRMGKGANFAKSDLVDAYKLIPSHTSEWGFYDFKWLGNFFADTTIPFRSTASPTKFVNTGATIGTSSSCRWIRFLGVSAMVAAMFVTVSPKSSNFAGATVNPKGMEVFAKIFPNHLKL